MLFMHIDFACSEVAANLLRDMFWFGRGLPQQQQHLCLS
jgi:hypothetical protein